MIVVVWLIVIVIHFHESFPCHSPLSHLFYPSSDIMDQLADARRYNISNNTRSWSNDFFQYLYLKTLPLLSGNSLIDAVSVFSNSFLRCCRESGCLACLYPRCVSVPSLRGLWVLHAPPHWHLLWQSSCQQHLRPDCWRFIIYRPLVLFRSNRLLIGKIADVTAYVVNEEVVVSVLLLEGNILELHFPVAPVASSVFASFYEALQGIAPSRHPSLL